MAKPVHVTTTLPRVLRDLAREHGLNLAELLAVAVARELFRLGVDVPETAAKGRPGPKPKGVRR